MKQNLELGKQGSQYPQGDHESYLIGENSYFIGMNNLTAFFYDRDTEKRYYALLVRLTRFLHTTPEEYLLYDNLYINPEGRLETLGAYHGNTGNDRLRALEGQPFCLEDNKNCYWGMADKMRVSASCAKYNATLAYITDFADLNETSDAVDEVAYLTGYFVTNPKTYFPPVTDNMPIRSEMEESETGAGLHQCVTVKRDKYFISEYCHNRMSVSCMYPASCPPGFKLVGVRCYHLVEESSGDTTFLDALARCNRNGSGLAHPVTRQQMSEVAWFVKVTVDWNKHPEDFVEVAIGLNVAFGDPSLDGMYEVEKEVWQAVNNSGVNGKGHLYLTVHKNETWELTATDFNSTAALSVCEFHGLLGCLTPPPPAPEHAVTERRFGNLTIHELATYTCDPGFFVDGEVGKKVQNRSCHGQLGGWAPLEPLSQCIGVVVCNETLPMHPHMTNNTSDSIHPGYETYWIDYVCPKGMATADGEMVQRFNCKEYNGAYKYNGEREHVEECNQCLNNPYDTVANSKSKSNAGPWMVDSKVTVECMDGYLVDNTHEQQVVCTVTGWKGKECKKVCLDEPEVANATTDWSDTMWEVGEMINVTCNNGFFVPNEINTRRTMECTDDGWENLEGCVQGCLGNLKVGNATVDQGTMWEVGTKITATCIDDLLFVSANASTLKVACTENGWEKTEGCLKVCEGKPEVANGTTDWSSGKVWPDGSHVKGTCDPGLHLYPSAENEQRIACTSEGWQNATTCEQVCFQSPDLADEHAFWDGNTDNGRLGDEVPARCYSNYYNAGALNETNTIVRCNPNGWEAVHPCVLSCRVPPTFNNLNITWVDREPGTLNDEVWFDCPIGYRNSKNMTLNTTLVRCTKDEWKHMDTCLQVCEEDPDTANSKIVWEPGHLGVVLSEVAAKCQADHFSNNTLTDNTTKVQCNAGVGWVVTHPCVQVCGEPPNFGNVSVDWGSRGPKRIADNVTLNCPDGYRNNDTIMASTTTVSCTPDGWAHLDSCAKACTVDPDADATNIEWGAGSVAFLDTELTVECRENFYSNETLNGTTTQVQCVETGWWVVHPCVRVCTNRPDFGNVTLEWDNEREPGREGDMVTLACPEERRSNTTLTSHNTTILCTPDGWVDVDPCVEVCLLEDLGGKTLSEEEDGVGVWKVGEEARRHCPDDLLTANTTENVTSYVCTEDGWNVTDPCVAVCRERLNVINADSNFDLRTWTKGQELLVVCLRDHRVSPGIDNYTVPCTETGWLNFTANCSYCEYFL
ncbi:complement factor H-like [Eriocheir sinensis]|uniref:complement factor H-like n=1 Tax=Eriocheir sinensis TaxID=95602 RepID=UPI0021C85BA0|nr:complement factor H-like [Eriocheir sinensis]